MEEKGDEDEEDRHDKSHEGKRREVQQHVHEQKSVGGLEILLKVLPLMKIGSQKIAGSNPDEKSNQIRACVRVPNSEGD